MQMYTESHIGYAFIDNIKHWIELILLLNLS